jgi:CRISPR-associated protein Csm5
MFDQARRDQLGVRYRLCIQTLSPLHVGAGGEDLQRRTPDFLSVNGRLTVIDPDKLTDVLGPQQIERLIAGVSMTELLEGLDDDQKLALAAYSLQDPGGDVMTIRPHIKLPGARPYLPGSSLKGALRTALAWAMLADGVAQVRLRDLGRNRYWASSGLEKALFGSDPNHDLLRALHVGDSEGTAWQGGLRLAQVAVYSIQHQRALAPKGPRYRFHLETIPEGVTFTAEVRRDNFILEPAQVRQLSFGERPEYLLRLPHHANRLAEQLIGQERDFYRRYGPARLVEFYERLRQTLAELDRDRACLVQVAWGTGWTGKTVGPALDEALLTEVKARYRLGRRDAVFPKTRRLVERGSEAVMPLGWLQVAFESLGEEVKPAIAAQAQTTTRPQAQPVERPRTIEDLQVGQIIEGTVDSIVNFGAFVNIGLPFNGLIHISELSEGWVERVEDVVRVGQVVRVRVIEVDRQRRRIGLSLKQV